MNPEVKEIMGQLDGEDIRVKAPDMNLVENVYNIASGGLAVHVEAIEALSSRKIFTPIQWESLVTSGDNYVSNGYSSAWRGLGDERPRSHL